MAFLPFVLLSTIVFAVIIFFLVSVLTFVEAKVSGKDASQITINDQKDPLLVSAGKNLLITIRPENGPNILLCILLGHRWSRAK